METKPHLTTRGEAKPSCLGLAPKAHGRPGARVRAKSPRTVTVTLAEVISAVQDCTDDDELVVSVIMHLMRSGQARSLGGANFGERCAAA
jgi:hypothetical protein